jgi:hypothetical protein
MEVSAEGVVKLNSDVVVPIVLKPVTVSKVVLVEQFGPVRGAPVKLKWASLDCANPRACTPLFGPFSDLVKEMKPELGEEDLAQ